MGYPAHLVYMCDVIFTYIYFKKGGKVQGYEELQFSGIQNMVDINYINVPSF
jgi:hypothetical protein